MQLYIPNIPLRLELLSHVIYIRLLRSRELSVVNREFFQLHNADFNWVFRMLEFTRALTMTNRYIPPLFWHRNWWCEVLKIFMKLIRWFEWVTTRNLICPCSLKFTRLSASTDSKDKLLSSIGVNMKIIRNNSSFIKPVQQLLKIVSRKVPCGVSNTIKIHPSKFQSVQTTLVLGYSYIYLYIQCVHRCIDGRRIYFNIKVTTRSNSL